MYEANRSDVNGLLNFVSQLKIPMQMSGGVTLSVLSYWVNYISACILCVFQ